MSECRVFSDAQLRGRPSRARLSLLWFLIVPWLLLFTTIASATPATNTAPAKLKVSGYGLLGDLRLKKMLKVLNEGKTKPEFFDSGFVEDAVLLIASKLRDEGRLAPVITIRLTLDDGRKLKFIRRESDDEPLPHPLRIKEARFRIKKGVLYHFRRLEFSGLEAIPEKRARAYFIETGGMLALKENRAYSPTRFDRAVANLRDALHRMGYQDAAVSADHLGRNDRNGAMDVRIRVNQGMRYIVHSVSQEAFFGNTNLAVDIRTNFPDRPYSRYWEQDYIQSLKTNYFHLGYPDTTVELQPIAQDRGSNDVRLAMRAIIKTGALIHTGDIRFVGNKRTKEPVLEARVPLHEGDLLDRIRAENGRYRLSRLGIFDSVELKYDTIDEHTRAVIYDVREGKRIDVSLLFGYGSYELLRGGVQLDQYNVWGRAHHQRLKVTQSFKSSSGDYTYTMPEFFGENIDVFFNGSGLRREEISFTRVEYGGGAGVRKYFRGASTDLSVRYNYQILEAGGAATNFVQLGTQNSGVGAIIADINHDRRDNPLYPHRGYKAFGNVEVASEYLASEVNYQRIDLALSLHLPLSDSQWLHFGVSHGLVATVGSAAQDLPFNRRFFPGGENSVRGYQEGQAAPRDADGKIVGAETYTLGNVEFEQGLTPKWSLVFFADGVGFARQLEQYPENQALFSVGGGLRWKTIIGPVRVEYGYNLNPRPRDPSGTLNFSLGFPF